ncbi:ComEA family DNA-binding protein [Sediminibacterium ginsengisoli]|uniref:DNA uptake protein ComE n=1 Tax=Sediminibacterium ginsengisoli TaxID=413434 RepID=A0A1T4JZR8_9BACT|nr:helix-hairpin-helix domain-containing protein [Sediminibacterium ginsengisoli]SJZ35670.1 DNA uptake protein ComE [Sediminibacterium ginsengisoli]
MKQVIKEYLSFTKKERLAVLVLLVLITVFLILPGLMPPHIPDAVENEALHHLLTRPQSIQEIPENKNKMPDKPGDNGAAKPGPSLFLFDPNTITQKEWMALGLKERTAQTILRFRDKGGRFRTPADLGKVWGLRKEEVERLTPYVRIAASGENNRKPDNKTQPAKPVIIDINTAGETDWAQLPGIGKRLAGRIVHFRTKMNGFVRVEQVAKTYGLSDSQYQLALPYLQCRPETARKIDINTTTAWELISACDLPGDIAYAIIRERKRKSSFKRLDELKNIAQLSDTTYQRLEMILTIREP